MKQRACIAIASSLPRVIIADEPHSGASRLVVAEGS